MLDNIGSLRAKMPAVSRFGRAFVIHADQDHPDAIFLPRAPIYDKQNTKYDSPNMIPATVGADAQGGYSGTMTPSLRKPFGVLLIVVLLIGYALLIAGAANRLSQLPSLVQAPIYLILGVIWILPLRPLLRWMETGRLRK